MQRVLLSLVLLTFPVACAKRIPNANLAQQEDLKLAPPGPAPGRAEFVTPVAIIPDPSKYHSKRIILAGIWKTGFEHSLLDLENSAQEFGIWVDADWSKIDQPMGDFSRRGEAKEDSKRDENGFVSHRIVAEGTFYYRKADLKAGGSAFGHMGVSNGYFLIDRLFQFDPL